MVSLSGQRVTIAERARAHALWPDYVAALEADARMTARECSLLIARDLDLTTVQRVKNLPRIAAHSGQRGRPRKPKLCPHCGVEL